MRYWKNSWLVVRQSDYWFWNEEMLAMIRRNWTLEPTTDLRNSYIKQSSVSRVFFVTLRVKNMGKYPNKIKPCYSKHILLDPQPLLYLEWGSIVDSYRYITICIKKCHRHGSCNNDWEKVYKMFKFLHLQYVYVTGKLNSD